MRVGTSLLHTLPAVVALVTATALPAATPIQIHLTHWAAGGGWRSQWSVVNTGPGPLNCTLNIVGPDGQPLSLETSAGTGSSVSFPVAQGGTGLVQAGGAGGAAQSGSSNVSCTDLFVADVTYAWMSQGEPVTEVTVLPTGQFDNFVFAATANTGIALYNADGNTATATVSAFDRAGNPAGSAMTTIPAQGKTTLNLSQLLTSLPSSFNGKVPVHGSTSIEVVPVDVLPGAGGGFVLGNVPVAAFNDQPATAAGSYHFLTGSLAGQSGIFSINNFSPFGNLSGAAYMFAAVTSGSNTGTATLIEMNNGLVLVHLFKDFAPLPGAAAILYQQADGTFAGSIYFQGSANGSTGTITLTLH